MDKKALGEKRGRSELSPFAEITDEDIDQLFK